MTISNPNSIARIYSASNGATTKPTSKHQLPPHILEEIIWSGWVSNCTTEERINMMTTLPLVNTTIRNYAQACESRHIFIPCPSYVAVFLSKLYDSLRFDRNTFNAFGITIDGDVRVGGAWNMNFDSCFELTILFDLTDVLKHGDDDLRCADFGDNCVAGRVYAAEKMMGETMERFLISIIQHEYLPLLHEINLKFVDMDTPRILNTLNILVRWQKYIAVAIAQLRM